MKSILKLLSNAKTTFENIFYDSEKERDEEVVQLFQNAQAAIQKAFEIEEDQESLQYLNQAKNFYGLLIAHKKTSADEQRAALCVLVAILISIEEFERAAGVFRLLDGDFDFNTKYLPQSLQACALMEGMGESLKVFHKLYLGNCNIKGKSVEILAHAIETCSQIDILDIQKNPFNTEEVNLLLDAILKNKNKKIGHINLSQLPIDGIATQKIITLIETSTTLNLDLSSCQNFNIAAIIHAVEKAKNQEIKVTLANPNIIEVSSAKFKRVADFNNRCESVTKIVQTVSSLYDELMMHPVFPKEQYKKNILVWAAHEGKSFTKLAPGDITINKEIKGNDKKVVIIGAEDSELVIEKDIIISKELIIKCKKLTIKKGVKISVPNCHISTKEFLLLDGELNSDQVQLVSCNVIFDTNAKIQNKLGHVFVKAVNFQCLGTIDSKYLTVDANVNALSSSAIINAEEMFLSSPDVPNQPCHIESAATIQSPALYLQTNGSLNTTGHLNAKKIQINGGKVKLGGEIVVAHSETIANAGESQQIDFKVNANALTLDGKIQVDSFHLDVNQLFAKARSRLSAGTEKTSEQSILPNSIQCKERFYTDTGSSIESNYPLEIKTKQFTHHGNINSKKNSHLVINGCGEVFKDGKINAKENMLVEGDRLWNSGEIEAEGHLNLAFDKFFILGICDFDPINKFKNKEAFGLVKGKNTTITSALFLNVLGYLDGQDSNQINSFLELNVGLETGKNISHSNIVGLDLGVNLTAIESVRSVLSMVRDLGSAAIDNDKKVKEVIGEYWEKTDGRALAMSSVSVALQMASIAAKLLLLLAPQVGIPFNIVVSSINVLLQLATSGFQIKNEIGKLIDKYQKGDLHPRDVYQVILAVKNAAVAGVNVAMIGFNMPQAIKTMPEQIKNATVITDPKVIATSVLPSVAAAFAGSTSKQSVLSVEGGATVTGLNSSTSVLQLKALNTTVTGGDFNNSAVASIVRASAEFASSSYTSAQLVDHGNDLSMTGNQTIVADKTKLGGVSYTDQLNINSTELTQESGLIHARLGLIHTEQARLNATVDIDSGALQTKQLETTEVSQVTLKNMGVKTEEASLSGQVNFSGSVVEAKKFDVNETAKFHANNTSITSDTMRFAKQSESTLDHVLLTANDIKQEKNSKLETNTVGIVANQTQFSGETVTHNQLSIEAKDKATFTESAKVTGEKDSEFGIKSSVIVNDGEIKQGKISLDSHFSNDEVNNLVSKLSHYQASESFTVKTDVAVDIHEKITNPATEVNIIGTSVVNNVAQDVNHLGLQSTEGDVTLNKEVQGNGITIVSNRKITINESIHMKDEAILVAEGDITANSQVVKTQIPPNKHEKPHWGIHPGYRHHKHRPHVETKLNETDITASETVLISKGRVTLNGVDVEGSNSVVVIGDKGVVLNGMSVTLPSYSNAHRFGFLHLPHYRKITKGSSIHGHEGYIGGEFLDNNGQKVFGDTIYIDLKGDVTNRKQGEISATNLLLIKAHDVNNLCEARTVHGEYSDHTVYKPSKISGGDGEHSEGIGLFIDADGKVFNDASQIESKGTNVIEAKNGIENRAEASTYLAYKKDSSSCFGLKSKHVERWDTVIYCPSIISYNGENILYSSEGGITSDATYLLAARGSKFAAKYEIEFYGRVGNGVTKKNSSTLGIFHTHEKWYDEYSQPTILNVPPEGVTIVSTDSYIKMQDTVVRGPGHLDVSGIGFYASVSVLDHSYTKDSFGMGASIFGQEFAHTNTPHHANRDIFSSDPTISHFNRLANSNGALETGLNLASTGVQTLNTLNMIGNGIRNDQLASEFLRYKGIGDVKPKITLTFTKTHEEKHWQTMAEGEISVGSARINVGDGDIVFTGLPVSIENDFSIRAKDFKQEGILLNSSYEYKEQNLSLGVSATGNIYQVGVGVNGQSSSQTNYVNQQLYVGKVFDINTSTWKQDAANANVGHIQGQVNDFEIISRTDTAQSKSYGYSVDTSGNFSASQAKSKSALIGQVSGLHVRDSINGQTNDEFKVANLYLEGGSITSNGVINLKPETCTTVNVNEYSKSSGFSISGNWNDFTPKNQANKYLSAGDDYAKSIKTVNLGFTTGNYQAEQLAVVFGEQGTEFDPVDLNGSVHTTSANGTHVIKDEQHQYNVEIPLPDKETLAQMHSNLNWAAQKAGIISAKNPNVEKIIAFENLKTPDEIKAYLAKVELNYQLSKDVYDDNSQLPPGFYALNDVYYQDGLKVVVYVNDDTKEVIIAFRGTANMTNVSVDDMDIVKGNAPSSYNVGLHDFLSQQVDDFENQGYNVSFTGHSLGASLASMASSDFELPAFVYDNPGVNNPDDEYDFSKVTSFQSQPNLVNECGDLLGYDNDKGRVIQLEPTAKERVEIEASKLLGPLGVLGSTLHMHGLPEIGDQLDSYINNQTRKIPGESIKLYDVKRNPHLFFNQTSSANDSVEQERGLFQRRKA